MDNLIKKQLANNLNKVLAPLPWQERLRGLANYTNLNLAFSTSFSFEDQAITHVVAAGKLPIRVFGLDTERLFEETLEVYRQTREVYNLDVEMFYPKPEAVAEFVAKHGLNGFYESKENRIKCCHIRKVEPLERALNGVNVWLSGVRNEQSSARADLPVAEWDEGRGIIKVYPIVDVSAVEIWDFIKANNVPYNPMHEKGYPSIGCAPCTRAIKPGEPPRAGRWWWEQESEQECGLHVIDGKLVPLRQAPELWEKPNA